MEEKSYHRTEGGRGKQISTELWKKTSRELNVYKRNQRPHVSGECIGSPLAWGKGVGSPLAWRKGVGSPVAWKKVAKVGPPADVRCVLT